MDNVVLKYVPDVRDPIQFQFTARPLEECFDQIRTLCKDFKDDLPLTDFYVETQDGALMFCLYGCTKRHRVEEAYRDLEPRIAALCQECFEV